MVRFSLPRAEGIAELMDDPGIGLDEISANLRDLERVNRLFGGTRLILRHLKPMVSRAHCGEIQILDVATGGADIPAAIVRGGPAGTDGTSGLWGLTRIRRPCGLLRSGFANTLRSPLHRRMLGLSRTRPAALTWSCVRWRYTT